MSHVINAILFMVISVVATALSIGLLFCAMKSYSFFEERRLLMVRKIELSRHNSQLKARKKELLRHNSGP